MTVIPGVELERNDKGEAIHIGIDLQKHPKALIVLKEAGLMPKTDLEEEFDNALPVDEVFDRIEKKIKDHYAQRRNNSTC